MNDQAGTKRPALMGFGLDSLKDLPSLRELEDIARESGLAVADDESKRDQYGKKTFHHSGHVAKGYFPVI